MEENKTEIVDETTADVSNSETTQVNSEMDKPYRTFATEEDFNKFIKSESMKRVNELYKELDVKSMDELKTFKESSKLYSELKSSYDDLNTSKTSLEEQFNSIKTENDSLRNSLLINRLGVNEELSKDFLTLAASKMDENTSLEQAAESVLQLYPYFKNNTVKDIFKIGSPKSEDIKRDMTDDEKAQLKKYFGLK